MKNYRNVQLVKGKRWYVEYYYKIPEPLRYQYKDQEWLRFRVYEDVNRYKGEDKIEYAHLLLKAVKDQLDTGYNPFYPKEKLFILQESLVPSISDILKRWVENVEHSGNEKQTIDRYKRVKELFLEYLKEIGMQNAKPEEITEDFIEEYLKSRVKKKKWSNRNFNNQLSYLSTMFTWLVKKKS